MSRKYSTYNRPNYYGKKALFNEKMHKKYDIPARNKLKEILGDFVSDHPNKYAQDMIINSDTCKYDFLEVQVCTEWVNQNFPKQYPYIYERKKRYDDDTLFITFNKHLNRALLFDTKVLVSDIPVRLKKYSREFIYQIPWKRVSKININQFDKTDIEWY